MSNSKELRLSAYFSQNKADDMELWDFLSKFDTRTRSHYLKLLARLGIDAFEKQQLGRHVEIEGAQPIKPKRGRRPIANKPASIILSESKTNPATKPEPIQKPHELPTNVAIAEAEEDDDDDDCELVLESFDKSPSISKARANLLSSF